jgi:NitT/TauT family transport system substrate-binding protein
MLAALVLIAGSSALGQSTLTTIRLISAPSDDLRPVLYAQKAGLFRREGLDVVIQSSNSGAVAAQAVVAGAMDVGKSSLSALIAAYVRGLPFVLIAPSAIHQASAPNSAVIVATNSPMKSPLDLQGKTVGCTAIGDIGYIGIRALIDSRGGDSSTIKWVEIPTSAIAAALDQGRVDAGITTEPFMTKDLRAGKVRFLFDVLSGYPRPILESAFYATHQYVDKNRDVVARFAKAVAEGAAYSNTHPAETVPLFATFAGLEPEAAAQMHRTITATKFDPQAIQPVIDLAAKYKVIPRDVSARDLIAGNAATSGN